MRPRSLVLVAVAGALAGCGGARAGAGESATNAAAAQTAGGNAESPAAHPAAPARLRRQCRRLASTRRVPVLRPQRLPAAERVVSHRTLRRGPCEYLLDVDTSPHGSGDPFHLLAGGRCGRCLCDARRSLTGARPARSGPWARRNQAAQAGTDAAHQEHVRLHLLRRARVAGHPALLLAAAPYPNGGVHGGHIMVWNQGGNGYALTLHFKDDRRTAAEQAVVLLAPRA